VCFVDFALATVASDERRKPFIKPMRGTTAKIVGISRTYP